METQSRRGDERRRAPPPASIPNSILGSIPGSTQDELLRPTLGADFDVRSFRAPFDPRNLLWAGFFGGPLAGGALLAWNTWRLRQPRQLGWVVGLSLVLTLGCAAVGGWWLHAHGLEEQRTTVRLAQRAVGALFVLCCVPAQKKRFDAFALAGGTPGKVLVPSLVAIFGLGALQALLTAGVYAGLGGGSPP